MNKRIILLILFFSIIECETWLGEVNGHDKNDVNNGYAGSKGNAITGYYLCGGRKYRAHYLGDDKNTWTGEYWGCDEPIGIGRSIDAISISGGYGYQVRLKNGNWLPMIYGYDIVDSNNGYAGILGKEIDAILIEGGNYYRVCYGGHSSNIEEVSKRVVKKWFGIQITDSYEKEKTIIDNNLITVKVKLIGKWEFNFDGTLKFIIENNELKDITIGGLSLNELDEVFGKMIGDEKEKYDKFTVSFKVEMDNGQVTYTIDFLRQIITIDAGSKITKDYFTIRGAFRITIYIKNNDDNITKAQKFCLAVGNFVINLLKKIYDDLVSQLDDLAKLPQIREKIPIPFQPVFSVSLGFKFIVI